MHFQFEYNILNISEGIHTVEKRATINNRVIIITTKTTLISHSIKLKNNIVFAKAITRHSTYICFAQNIKKERK